MLELDSFIRTTGDRPANRTLDRRGCLCVGILALALSLLQAPGRISPDTKLDLTADPLGFLARATHLWTPTAPLGQVQNQAYGYFFPHGAFFAIGDLLALPPWLVQRLWWALLLTVGFIGLVRLAEVLGIGSYGSRLIAAAAFTASPRVLTTLGTISSETLPMVLAPWVLIPLVRALSPGDSDSRPGWQEALRSAVAVALMGAVNAVATGAAVAVAALWLVTTVATTRRRRDIALIGWWLVGLMLACIWWVVPLLLLSRVSPPFLDFIESSAVTTEWTSLTEVLRGTTSWTPFVSSERAAGAVLVSEPAAVIATGLVAAAGLAGLAMRAMPGRRRWLVILILGVLLLCLGYPGSLGSPIAGPVRDFLDGAGAPLRNVHKFDPLVRIPLALGLAHLLGRVRLTLPTRRTSPANTDSRSRAAALVLVAAIVATASLAWSGGLAPASSYRALPDYWRQTANWLADAQSDSATPARALVVPGAPFAQQLWGMTRDEPLQALASTPWAVRDAIPLTPPGAIRALDSIQRDLAAGRGSSALAPALRELGIGYLVLRADLDPSTSRSPRPLVVEQALRTSTGITKVASFGPAVTPPTVDGVVVDDGLRPSLPAVQVFAVGTDPTAVDDTGPRLVDAETMPRIVGGSESLLAVDRARLATGRSALGPALLAGDADAAGLRSRPLIVTDTPVDRETDFGKVDDHSSAIRAPDDPRLTKNAAADYPVDGADLVTGQWLLDNKPGRVQVRTSGAASDATAPGRTTPAANAASAFDGDPNTAWVSRGLDSAIGQWLALDFTNEQRELAVTVTTAKAIGPAVTTLLVTTDSGSTVVTGVQPGKPKRIIAPSGATRHLQIRAIEVDGAGAGNQFALAEVELSGSQSGILRPIRHRVVLPELRTGERVSEWVLHQELAGRSACVTGTDSQVRCSSALGLDAETPGVFSRTLSVPRPVEVDASVLLRPTPGAALGELLATTGTITASGAAAVTDPRGNASAAVDGNPNTVWTAPSSDGKKASKPTLTIHLPSVREVTGLKLTLPHTYPAAPTRVRIDTGHGKQTVRVGRDGTVPLSPTRTDTVAITVLDTSDLIDVNELGFSQSAPAGIAEVQVLGSGAAPAVADPDRRIQLRCDADPAGPYGLAVSAGGKLVRLQVDTTARALISGEPILATPCSADAGLTLASGEQEVAVNPGKAFSVDTVDLRVRPGFAEKTAPVDRPEVIRWDSTRRSVRVSAADNERVLTVPESTNPGWVAELGGRTLDRVVVNGWQQGWVVPSGTAGIVTLSFPLDTPYRWSLLGGGAALLVLFVGALWPGRRRHAGEAAVDDRHGRLGPIITAFGTAVIGWLIAGVPGIAIAAAATAVCYLSPPRVRVALVFGATLGGALILATGPWHSGLAYRGYDALPQAAALFGLSLAFATTAIPIRSR